MPKYRKKPVVVEAFQMTEVAYEKGDWPEWLRDAWRRTFDYDHHHDGMMIKTLEGVMRVAPDDYIIQGVHGELYPCKPDVFEATYDAVEGGE